MANTTYNIRLDERIRQDADELYRSMGLTLSQAINLFLTQSVIQRKLPLVEVIAAPKEVKEFKPNPKAKVLLDEAEAYFDEAGRPTDEEVEESILEVKRQILADGGR
ncbi:MAG: type II toxin-antitoxin system RelB/DinJ family antitoxin [Fusobacteriaceae bacterium]|jgi:DNA-damage-inducible protein J|nr:type II toxin-antitoxin system RelB/DinJ family antitoxin [Fusobacteriaceae bacterium]